MMRDREVHFFCSSRSRKLARLRCALPDLLPNNNCNPANIPPGSVCYVYPRGREHELEQPAALEGLSYELGVVGIIFTCCAAVGDYLYACGDDNFFYVWFIGDPESPTRSGFTPLNLGVTATDIAIYRSVAYVCGATKIFTINIDDPANPTLEKTTTKGTENWTHIEVVGDTIFVAGDRISHLTTDLDPEAAGLTTEEEPSSAIAGFAIQGRRLYEVEAATGFLRSFRVGGFFCSFIATGSLSADEISAETVSGRHAYLQGEVVASSIGAGGGPSESETGVVYAAQYFRVGERKLRWGTGSPEGVVDGSPGDAFFSDNGNIYRKGSGTGNTGWVAT